MTDIPPLEAQVANAIQQHDESLLRDALEQDWRPRMVRARPRLDSSGKMLVDARKPIYEKTFLYSLLAKRWIKGLHIFVEYIPEWKTDNDFWRACLEYGWHHAVEQYIKWGVNPSAITSEDEEYPFKPVHHVLWKAWNERFNAHLSGQQMLNTLYVLKNHGANIEEQYLGPWEAGDAKIAGHTPWTAACLCQEWALADALMPLSPEKLQGHKRWPDALENLVRMHNSPLRNHVEQQQIQTVLKKWLNLFGGDFWRGTLIWPDAYPQEWKLTFAEEWRTEPQWWGLLLQLEKDNRITWWTTMTAPDALGWTGLHELMLRGNEETVHKVVRLCSPEAGFSWKTWNTPDNDGVSPSTIYWQRAFSPWETKNTDDPPFFNPE